MLAKDLITLLEQKIKEHERMKEMMGELCIVVDRFEKFEDTHTFHYVGWDYNIQLEFDITTGHFIINAFVQEKSNES